MKALESMKANGIISIKPKGNRESYFVSDVIIIHGSLVITQQQKEILKLP